MRFSFYLPLRPFSVNSMYSRTREFKTREYKDWEKALLYALVEKVPKQVLKELREAFDPTKHCLSLRLISLLPRAELITKAGSISARSYDLSNIEKPLLDILMLPRYHQELQRMGGGNVNADDKHVITLSSAKRISADGKHLLQVSFVLHPLTYLD